MSNTVHVCMYISYHNKAVVWSMSVVVTLEIFRETDFQFIYKVYNFTELCAYLLCHGAAKNSD